MEMKTENDLKSKVGAIKRSLVARKSRTPQNPELVSFYKRENEYMSRKLDEALSIIARLTNQNNDLKRELKELKKSIHS